jgi:hypothetical protein
MAFWTFFWPVFQSEFAVLRKLVPTAAAVLAMSPSTRAGERLSFLWLSALPASFIHAALPEGLSRRGSLPLGVPCAFSFA